MKLVYEAQNSIEAHMIVNLLDQARLRARIDGEFLQGGVGELQTMGLVRVMVAEDDYAEARKLIEEWEQVQPRLEATSHPDSTDRLNNLFIGFVLGVITTLLIYQMVL